MPTPAGGTPVSYEIYIDWDNDGSVLSGSFEGGENVTAYVLGIRTALSWKFGRDTARALSAIQPGNVSLELDNATRMFSPDNTSSPLYGNLGPGKPILIRAIHKGITYNLFWGFLDEYEIDPHRTAKSVKLTAMDALGKMGENTVSTELYDSVQTGEAIGLILDAAGWPESQRDIDHGASTIRWFWAEQESALDAIKAIVASEGPTALAYVDTNGNFVFKSRHHRLIDTASTTRQVSLFANGEPSFSEPADYNIGFRDLVNSVEFEVKERDQGDLESVWSTEDTIILAAGETVSLSVQSENPFFDAITPVEGTDYTLLSASAVTVKLTRTSGQSTEVQITATGASYVQGMQVRARPVKEARTYKVKAESAASIAKYGKSSWTEEVPKWVGRHDAQALADLIVQQRAERLPVFTVSVNAGSDQRKVQQLSRTLSDRIRIVEAHTGTDHDHFIEYVEHNIEQVGKDHRVTFGCERVNDQTSPVFTFDVAGQGFDQGRFATGQSEPSNLFILGDATSGHRIGTGKLGN